MKKKIRIWIFTREARELACYQIRIISPFSRFPKDAFEFIFAPSWKAILCLPLVPDVVLIRRNYYPFGEIEKIAEFSRSKGIATVMDIDDLITQVPKEHPSYSDHKEIGRQIIRCIKKMDHITVTNECLGSRLKEHNPSVHILQNFLDERLWFKNLEEKINPSMNKDKLVVGYAGSPTHKYDFRLVAPAIKYILSKYKEKVSFKFFGCIPDELLGLPNTSYMGKQINSYQKYATVLKNSKFDFVIAPLEDNAFNQCKSNIKFLEYSACGFPGAYSKVGPYIYSVQEGLTGILAENNTENWIQSMEMLINNPALRGQLAKNAYFYVKNNYTLEKKAGEWLSFYEEISASRENETRASVVFSSFMPCGPYFFYAQLSKLYWFVKRSVIDRINNAFKSILRIIRNEGNKSSINQS